MLIQEVQEEIVLHLVQQHMEVVEEVINGLQMYLVVQEEVVVVVMEQIHKHQVVEHQH